MREEVETSFYIAFTKYNTQHDIIKYRYDNTFQKGAFPKIEKFSKN